MKAIPLLFLALILLFCNIDCSNRNYETIDILKKDGNVINNWKKNGYTVNKSERGFISTVILEKRDEKTKKVLSKYPRKVVLFCERQVSKLA